MSKAQIYGAVLWQRVVKIWLVAVAIVLSRQDKAQAVPHGCPTPMLSNGKAVPKLLDPFAALCFAVGHI